MFMFQYLFLATLWACFAGRSPADAFLITNDTAKIANQTYDYVIVGGGTAGLTIANRLTEDIGITVLVIEGGKDERNNTNVTNPENFGVNGYANLTWGYMTTNQTVGGKQKIMTVGKALGGSSAINGMIWTRGTASQYDALEALGNPGWNFQTLQKYMRRAEAFHAPNDAQVALGVKFSPAAHGTSGRVITGFPNPYPCPVCKVWDVLVDSAVSVFPGLRNDGNVDPCSGDPNGVTRSIYSIIPASGEGVDNNLRSSSAQSYIYSLSPMERPNLQILIQHQAARIVWDNKNKSGGVPKPRGVEMLPISTSSDPQGRSSVMVNVRKEVIVSAGSIGTPKFLELSGIGNRTLLEGFEIPVIVDLPAVGANLQDQSNSGALYNGTMNSTGSHAPPSGGAAFLTLTQVLGFTAAKAYVQELKSTLAQRATDIVALGGGVSIKGVQTMLEAQLKQYGEQETPVVEILYNVDSPAPGSLAGITWILLPQYRGSVHIMSTDPRVHPIINPNLLGTEIDFLLLVNATMAVRRNFLTPSAKLLYSTELSPGSSVQTDDQWREYVRNNYDTVLHPIGTASMLPRQLGGVVDQNLRVYGVQGVRVADASILPLQISAHLSSTVYGIAEMAADMIKGVRHV